MANNTGLDEADVEPGDLRTRLCQNATGLCHTTCQIPDIENSCSRDSSRKTPPSVGSARFSSPKTRPLPANPRECRRFSHTWKSHRRDRTGWLGRQDSNLGMAESKSAPRIEAYCRIRRPAAVGDGGTNGECRHASFGSGSATILKHFGIADKDKR